MLDKFLPRSLNITIFRLFLKVTVSTSHLILLANSFQRQRSLEALLFCFRFYAKSLLRMCTWLRFGFRFRFVLRVSYFVFRLFFGVCRDRVLPSGQLVVNCRMTRRNNKKYRLSIARCRLKIKTANSNDTKITTTHTRTHERTLTLYIV